MEVLLGAFVSGVVAGLGLAMPLGAIAVLLLREGATRGWPAGTPAAAGAATVDTLYCTAAVTAGAVLAPVVASWEPWPRVVGGLALLAIAGVGLLRAVRAPDPATATGTGASASVPGASRAGAWRRYTVFLGLTAVNPATLVYFAAVVTALSARLSSPPAAALFVAGVGAASLGWQLLLVRAGSLAGARLGGRSRRLTQLAGHGLVATLGAVMVAGALR